MEVKCIRSLTYYGLEESINSFIIRHPEYEIVQISYAISARNEHNCMVLYQKRKEQTQRRTPMLGF